MHPAGPHVRWAAVVATSRQLQLWLQHYIRVPSLHRVAVATHVGARCAQIYSWLLPNAHRFTVGYCQMRTDLQLVTAKCAQIYSWLLPSAHRFTVDHFEVRTDLPQLQCMTKYDREAGQQHVQLNSDNI